MKIKKAFRWIFGVIFSLLLILGIILFTIFKAKEIPYRDITDGYNYIYTDVEHNDERYTIAIEGSSLYGNMRHYMYNDKYSKLKYVLQISYALRLGVPIQVNDTLNYILATRKVNKALCKKYTDMDYIRQKCLTDEGYIKDSLNNSEDEYAIIYMLLKNGITCTRGCESGYTYVIWDDGRK